MHIGPADAHIFAGGFFSRSFIPLRNLYGLTSPRLDRGLLPSYFWIAFTVFTSYSNQ